jgi:SOS response regulatory protein OraA/RecX
MTPKDKAKELVDKFIEPTMEFDELDGYVEDKDNAKQCALIAVDEVIEALHEHHWQNRLIINYWEEVKQEIENYG